MPHSVGGAWRQGGGNRRLTVTNHVWSLYPRRESRPHKTNGTQTQVTRLEVAGKSDNIEGRSRSNTDDLYNISSVNESYPVLTVERRERNEREEITH